MATNGKINYYRVVVRKSVMTEPQTVQVLAVDAAQATLRTAKILGLSWREQVPNMTVLGPYKPMLYQIREWNAKYPQWRIETKEDGAAALTARVKQ